MYTPAGAAEDEERRQPGDGAARPCRAARRLLAAALTLSVTWSILVLYAMITPVYRVQGAPVEATIAFLSHSVTYLGHRVSIPVLGALAVQLVPVLAASLVIATLSIYSLLVLLASREPGPNQAAAALLAALVALASTGPLTGADRVAGAVARILTTGLRYPINAGYIDLGRAAVVPGPAHYLVAGPHGVLMWLAAAMTALAAVGSVAVDECRARGAEEAEPGQGAF